MKHQDELNLGSGPRLFIDAEGLLYRAACAGEVEVEWEENLWTYLCDHDIAVNVFDQACADLAQHHPGHLPVLVAGGRTNFRYGIWAKYKSNRKKQKKPAGYDRLLSRLSERADLYGWGSARFGAGQVEGDDVLGILSVPGVDVIASDDKDLLTVPGTLLRNGETFVISERDADVAFLTQTLVGDAADGYPGCPGIGEKRAAQILEGIDSLSEGWLAVVEAFRKAGKTPQFALTMARCARILRPGEFDFSTGTPVLWQPPPL